MMPEKGAALAGAGPSGEKAVEGQFRTVIDAIIASIAF